MKPVGKTIQIYCPSGEPRGVRIAEITTRIVQAVESIKGDSVAIVSHGAVGTLLYCHLAGKPIDRRWDQPPNGGGNYYAFTLSPRRVFSSWRAFDAIT